MGNEATLAQRIGRLFRREDKVAPEALKEPLGLVLRSGVTRTEAGLNLLASEFNDKRYPSGCSLSVWNKGADQKKAQMSEHLRKGTVVKHGDKSIVVTDFGYNVESGIAHPEVHVSVSSMQR